MKLQGLAVIAIIIILPMSIILSSYSQSQIKTLQLQTQYDSKLQNAISANAGQHGFIYHTSLLSDAPIGAFFLVLLFTFCLYRSNIHP